MIHVEIHAGCLGLHCLPTNDWHCPHCKDKFGPGRKTTGESRPIIIRLKRVVKAPEFEPGGCVICRFVAAAAVCLYDFCQFMFSFFVSRLWIHCIRKFSEERMSSFQFLIIFIIIHQHFDQLNSLYLYHFLLVRAIFSFLGGVTTNGNVYVSFPTMSSLLHLFLFYVTSYIHIWFSWYLANYAKTGC